MSIYNVVYNFQLIKSTKQEGENSIHRKLVVRAYSRHLSSSNFYFSIRCNYNTQETFAIESLAIVDDGRFSGEKEKKIYLMGVFGFGATYCVDQAFDELKNELNGSKADDRIYSEEWDKFSSQLQSWYNNKIRPLFARDIELTKLYFSNNEN